MATPETPAARRTRIDYEVKRIKRVEEHIEDAIADTHTRDYGIHTSAIRQHLTAAGKMAAELRCMLVSEKARL